MPHIPPLYIIIPIVFFLFIGIITFWRWRIFTNRKKKTLKNIPHYLKKIKTFPHQQQILEYDKILDKCLFAYGYKGSTGQKMKKYGKNFKNQHNIWTAHKLRNRIAHEMGFEPTRAEFEVCEQYFLVEIRKFL